MTKIHMVVRVRHSKVSEFLQVLESLADTVRGFDGCRGFHFHFLDAVNDIDILVRFSGRQASDAYLASREHMALLGAAATLGERHALAIQESDEEQKVGQSR